MAKGIIHWRRPGVGEKLSRQWGADQRRSRMGLYTLLQTAALCRVARSWIRGQVRETWTLAWARWDPPMGIQEGKEAVILHCSIVFFPCALCLLPFASIFSLARPRTLPPFPFGSNSPLQKYLPPHRQCNCKSDIHVPWPVKPDVPAWLLYQAC